MSKSFAKTQACNLAEFNAISLASGRQERCYKGSLLFIVLLPVCFTIYRYAAFWFLAPAQYFSLGDIASPLTLLLCLAAIILLLFYLLAFYLRPLNHLFGRLWLRKNEAGWWLGEGNAWQPVQLTGEILITQWLIILRIQCERDRYSQRIWLWQDCVGANTHRKLRVLLQQGY